MLLKKIITKFGSWVATNIGMSDVYVSIS